MRKPIIGLLVALALVIAACSESTGSNHFEAFGGSSVDGGPEVIPASPDSVAGLETFRSVGCAACHGSDGEGGIGPALAGHTEEQVFRQVRTPKGGVMPAFAPDLLSDEEIMDVVAWIGTLGDEMIMAHGPEEGDEHGDEADVVGADLVFSGTEIAHMRLALGSVEVGNLGDAVRHLEHMSLHGAKPEVEVFAADLEADLAAGDIHDFEQRIVDVLGGLADEDFDAALAHMGMAVSAFQRTDEADVEFHLREAAREGVGEDHGVDLSALLEQWRSGEDQHAVIDVIFAALGEGHPVHQ